MHKRVRQAFRISVLLKGIYSLLELFAGIVLLIVSSQQVIDFVDWLLHAGFSDNNWLSAHIVSFFTNFTPALKLFISIYLIIHGAVKFSLLGAIWLRKIKAYPIAIGIFILFIVYQTYEYVISPSLSLIILSLLDILVIILTWLEYYHIKKYGTLEI